MSTTVKTTAAVPIHVGTDHHGTRSVIVLCPLCRRKHIHGWPPGDARPGLRIAHCADPGLTYLIEAPKGVRP